MSKNKKADIDKKNSIAESPSQKSAATGASDADKSAGSSGEPVNGGRNAGSEVPKSEPEPTSNADGSASESANGASRADSEASASEARPASKGFSASTEGTSLGQKKAIIDEAYAALEQAIKPFMERSKQKPKSRPKPKMLTHGVYSNDYVLPWESAADYGVLYDEFKQEWQPQGRSEEEAVSDLTHFTWLKRRAQKMSLLTYHRHPFATDLVDVADTWADILALQRLRTTTATDLVAAIETTVRTMNVVATEIHSIPHDFNTPPGKETQQAMFAFERILMDGISRLEKTIPVAKPWSNEISEAVKTFDLAYDPDLIDREVRTVAAIQARIDKLLSRLTSLKEYKRTVASRALPQVTSPAIAQSSEADADDDAETK